MLKRLVPATLVLILASNSFAEKKKFEPNPIMPDVTARGRALYEYDEAAWRRIRLILRSGAMSRANRRPAGRSLSAI
jgi:hypothetical protein